METTFYLLSLQSYGSYQPSGVSSYAYGAREVLLKGVDGWGDHRLGYSEHTPVYENEQKEREKQLMENTKIFITKM